jgi:hypothetical protein
MEVMTPMNVVRMPRHHENGRVTIGLPDSSYRAFELLYFGCMLSAVAGGVGKIFGVLAPWERYVPELGLDVIGFYMSQWIKGVGLCELVLAAIIAARPRAGGWLAALWSFALAVDVTLVREEYAIAGFLCMLAVASSALAFLAQEFTPQR